jgi:hypothetical protein
VLVDMFIDMFCISYVCLPTSLLAGWIARETVYERDDSFIQKSFVSMIAWNFCRSRGGVLRAHPQPPSHTHALGSV